MVRLVAILLPSLLPLVSAIELPRLAAYLKGASSAIFPGLKGIAVDVFNHPEPGTHEVFAHDRVTSFFAKEEPNHWKVTRHAYGQSTAWELVFQNRPRHTSPHVELPTIGFLAEYDAVGNPATHACGHHQILLNGIAAAELARAAIIKYDIPAKIVVVGCPDEEISAGKARLLDAGAFDSADIWIMAHPTSTNAVQPMQARINARFTFKADTHAALMRVVYNALVLTTDLAGKLPGTASSASPVEDVGLFSANVVQTEINFGIGDVPLDEINTIASGLIADGTYPGVSFSLAEDTTGVALKALGPGGHSSEGTKTPLRLTIELFRALVAKDPNASFYLPNNTTALELDITNGVRTRYTIDLDSVLARVKDTLSGLAASVTTDLAYPALEVVPYLPDAFINLMKDTDHDNQTDWQISNFAPAAADASFLQNAVIDPATKKLLSVERVVFHPNFGLCDKKTPGSPCGFNHEPIFAKASSTEYSYTRTEIVARALAQIAVELVADKDKMKEATKIIKKPICWDSVVVNH